MKSRLDASLKTKGNLLDLVPLWAGLLLLGNPVLSWAANENVGELQVHYKDGLVSLTAHEVPLDIIVQEIALKADLRLVQHVALDRLVSIEIGPQPLPNALDEVFDNESYQLYQAATDKGGAEDNQPIPGALWIFSEGSAFAPAATGFLEVVVIEGDL
jgi:hypothetical protein